MSFLERIKGYRTGRSLRGFAFITVLEFCIQNIWTFFKCHQLADAVLKITFSVSKIVGNVSYQINLAKYRISPSPAKSSDVWRPNVAGLRWTSPDVFADVAVVAGVFQTSLDVFQMSPDVLGTSPDVAGCCRALLRVVRRCLT